MPTAPVTMSPHARSCRHEPHRCRPRRDRPGPIHRRAGTGVDDGQARPISPAAARAPGSRRSLTRPLPQVEPLSTKPPRPTCPNPFTAVSPHVLALALALHASVTTTGAVVSRPIRLLAGAAVWPRGVLLALPSLGRNSSKWALPA